MRMSIKKIVAIAAALGAGSATNVAAAPAQEHTYSGTVSVPVWVPADSLPAFTVDLDDQTINSQDVVGGGGVLVLTFAGSTTEPSTKTQKCQGHGEGTRLRLIGLSSGTVVSAAYTPAAGPPFASQPIVVPVGAERVDTAVCSSKR